MLRAGGSTALYYGDNIQLTFDIPVLGFTGVEVTTARILEFQTESNVVYELQSAVPPATNVWTSVGVTVTGDGSTMFAYDPAEPSGSDTGKVYRASEIR
jgi:hypothetical protein